MINKFWLVMNVSNKADLSRCLFCQELQNVI